VAELVAVLEMIAVAVAVAVVVVVVAGQVVKFAAAGAVGEKV
jgi:hypothetical protein